MRKKIKSLRELKKLARNTEIECAIILNYGVFSRKSISYLSKSKKFSVQNWIDDTSQVLTEKQIMDKRITNIGYAISKGALRIM